MQDSEGPDGQTTGGKWTGKPGTLPPWARAIHEST